MKANVKKKIAINSLSHLNIVSSHHATSTGPDSFFSKHYYYQQGLYIIHLPAKTEFRVLLPPAHRLNCVLTLSPT